MLSSNQRQQEYNAHQKAVYIAILLKDGDELTTAYIAQLTGITWDGAEYMMVMISGVLPILKVEGKWKWIE